MKNHDITIKFTISEDEYKQYDKYIDYALSLILPYGKDFEVKENEYEEEKWVKY